MKTIIVVLLASASLGRATQIDLTPGGFSPLNPPPVFVEWEQTYHQIIAHVDISGNTVTWHPSFPLGGDNFVVDRRGALARSDSSRFHRVVNRASAQSRPGNARILRARLR